MLRSYWLHNLFGTAHCRKDRLCAATQQRRVHLLLESLEDRITPAPIYMYDPRVAVHNALVAQSATSNQINQIINNIIHSASGQANSPGQNGIGNALAALSQVLVAISQEQSSTSFLNNPASLLELQLQQQMAQNGNPPPTGISVSPLAN